MKKNDPNWGAGNQTTSNKLGQSWPAGSLGHAAGLRPGEIQPGAEPVCMPVRGRALDAVG